MGLSAALAIYQNLDEKRGRAYAAEAQTDAQRKTGRRATSINKDTRECHQSQSRFPDAPKIRSGPHHHQTCTTTRTTPGLICERGALSFCIRVSPLCNRRSRRAKPTGLGIMGQRNDVWSCGCKRNPPCIPCTIARPAPQWPLERPCVATDEEKIDRAAIRSRVTVR